MRRGRSIWMSVAAGLALAGLAGASGREAMAAGRANAVAGAGDAVVRFDLYDGYCMVAHGSAGGLKNLNFVLDTGTMRTTFNARIAGKLNLRDATPAGMVSAKGREQAEDAVLPSLELGPVQRTNLEIETADLSFLEKTLPVRVDAIVGLDVLGQRPFVIDYAARVIRFEPAPALAVSVPLRIQGGLAVLDAEIDQRPVHLLFDTGASAMVLFRASGAEADARQVRLRSVRVGPSEFGQEPALEARNPKPSQIDFDGVMSPAALGITRVAVDLEDGVLAFSR